MTESIITDCHNEVGEGMWVAVDVEDVVGRVKWESMYRDNAGDIVWVRREWG
jgi:hypothetical protein